MRKQHLVLTILIANTVTLFAGEKVGAQSPADYHKLLQRIERLEADVAQRRISDEALRKRLEALSVEIDQVLQANDARLEQIESGLKRVVDQQGRMVNLIDTSVAASQRSQGNVRFASYERSGRDSRPKFQSPLFSGEPPAEIIVVIDGIPMRFRRGGRVSGSKCDDDDGYWSWPEPQLMEGYGGSPFRTASFFTDSCDR